MASTLEQLRARRADALERHEKVERLLAGERADLEHIAGELDAEREHRDEMHDRRKELADALEAEVEQDENGEGERSDDWEAWAAGRREELGDLIDASIARIQRLLERGAKSEKERRELVKRDRKLEADLKVVERRIARKLDPAGNLTKDFSVAEFDCNNGTPCPQGIVPHLKALCVAHLQPLRDSGGTVSINSGYRTRAYNASIGGATDSYHIYDLRMRSPAADHIQAGRAASAVAAWHDSHDAFDGMGRYASFTHGDDRGYYSRWSG